MRSGELVARRAGVTRRSPLRVDGCRFGGATEVDQRGRWFVYADVRVGGRDVETWFPVHVERDGASRMVASRRYAYLVGNDASGDGIKLAASIALYAAMLALLGATFRLLRVGRTRGSEPSYGGGIRRADDARGSPT